MGNLKNPNSFWSMFLDDPKEQEKEKDTLEVEVVEKEKEEGKTEEKPEEEQPQPQQQQQPEETPPPPPTGKKKFSSFFSRRVEELEAKVLKYETQEKNLKDELNKKFLEAVKKKSEEAVQLIQEKEKEIEKKYTETFEEKVKFYYEDQLTELVNIYSRLESVVLSSSENKEVQNYLLGFKMFLAQFENLFSSLNIEAIVPSLNEEFDSEVMESVETEQVSEEEQKNKILHIFSKGYKLHNRVIKLAQVKVGI